MNKNYLNVCGILFILSILSIPGVNAGHLKTQPQGFNFNLQSTETDTLTLTTENDYDIDLKFIALNPGGNPMPISSIVGFNTRIEETTDGFKWSYDLKLPNSDFVAKVLISSTTPITILEDKYIVIDGSLISFDDVLDYGYSFSLTQIDVYNAEYEITKDYLSHGINQGDLITIDPTITSYPANDGYLSQNNVGVIDTFLTTTYLRAGVIDGSPDYNDLVTRTYIRFNTGEIDYYDTIINATLRIYLDTKTQSGGQTCNAILESIDDFEDLGAFDWDITATTINSSFVLYSDATGVYYEQDVSNYITKDDITAFRIKGSYETYNLNSCRFGFSSNETINSPELEIYWTDGSDYPTKQLFNVSDSTSKQIYPEYSCGWLLPSTQPYDPKIACETDGDSCVAIFYDNQPLCSQGLKYSVSRDGFDTIEYHGLISSKAYATASYLTPMIQRGSELPYDIAYDDNTNHYYIVYDNKVYVIPTFDPQVAGVTPYRVTDGYNLAVGGSVGADMSVDCATETEYGTGYYCLGISSYNPLRFDDSDPTNLFMVYSCQIRRISPSDYNGGTWYVTYDVTNTTTTANGNLYDCVELDTTTSCSAGGSFGWDEFNGYAEWSGSEWKYNIEGQIDYCPGTQDRAIQEDNLGSPIDDFNQMFFGGNLYYRNNTVFQILTGESTDLNSFGTPELQYSENTLINEVINQSDAVLGGNSIFYIWQRTSDLTDGSDGIWLQEQTTYPIVVYSNKNVFVTLSCDSEDYTTTGSGKIIQLFTPCLTGNQITFVSEYTPNVDTLSLDFGSCDAVTYSIYYPDNPYDFTFTVKDSLTQDNLENAEIYLTGESAETTDSYGKAIFNIQAINNPDFKVTQTGCHYDLSTDGTAKTFYGVSELSGYVDNEFTIIPGKKTIGDINTWEFDNNKLISMYPNGVVIDAHVYTSDGQEIFVDNYNVSVTGNNDDTFTFSDTHPTRRNWNIEVPATFLLYDNRSDYTITIDLTYPGGSDTQDLDVEINNQYDVYFYLPFTLLDLPCSDLTDCVPDFCSDDGYHHKLTGCEDNQCKYITTDCFSPDLCDSEIGCFAFDSEMECSNDLQCQNNENVTYCIDYGSMYIGKCGSDGFCKQTEKICSTFCNETIGYCNEKALCRIAQVETIGFEYSGGSSYVKVYCDFESSGTDRCIQMGSIPKTDLEFLGITISEVLFSHNGFGLLDVGDSYKVSDVSVSCSDSCEMTLNFCPSGECSRETGRCLTGETDTTWSAMIWGGWMWISGIIPIELRMLAWLGFTVLTMMWYRDQKKTNSFSSNNNTDTIIVGLFMLFAGFGVGFIHWIFLLIIGVITSLILWAKIGQ